MYLICLNLRSADTWQDEMGSEYLKGIGVEKEGRE